MTFWQTATSEAKLAQIDGAISLGLTAIQLGMNCGTDAHNIYSFASRHGRKFGHERKGSSGELRADQTRAVKSVQRVSRRFGGDPSNSVIARIFPDDRRANLFEPHPMDEVF